MFYNFPEELYIGIALFGYFFVMSELFAYNQKATKFFLFLSVFSFIALPQLLSVVPKLLNYFSNYSQQVTLLTIGSVILVFDLKIRKRKVTERAKLLESFKVNDDEVRELENKMEELKKILSNIEKEIK